MPGEPTLAKAWIGLVPTLDGAQKQIARELQGVDSDGIGKEHGRRLSAGFKIAVAGGGLIFAKEIKDMIGEASNLNESLNAVGVTFGENSDAIKELGRDAAESLGLSNNEFNSLAVQFSAFTKTIAGDGGDVTGTLDDLTTRASDFASVMNLDVAEAARLFQSGLAGETEPLRRYGIDVSAAAVQSYAYANGIAEVGSTLTEAQKVQARYGTLMAQTAKTEGDFANTSGELANSSRIMSAEWKNLQAQIGTKLLPIMKTLVEWGRKVIDWISANTDILKPFVIILGALGVALWIVTSPVTALIAGIALLAAGLTYFFMKTEAGKAIWEALATSFQWAWDNVLHPVIKALAATWSWLWDNVLGPVFGFMVASVRSIGAVWATVFGAFATVVTGAVDVVQTIFGSIVNWFRARGSDIANIFGAIGNAIKAPFQAAFNAIAKAWNYTIGKLSFTIPSWVPFGWGGKTWDVPDLPYWTDPVTLKASSSQIATLDSGAIVTRPTIAALAVNSRPEAVIPLDEWDARSGNGGVNIYVSGVPQPDAMAQAIAAAQRLALRAA